MEHHVMARNKRSSRRRPAAAPEDLKGHLNGSPVIEAHLEAHPDLAVKVWPNYFRVEDVAREIIRLAETIGPRGPQLARLLYGDPFFGAMCSGFWMTPEHVLIPRELWDYLLTVEDENAAMSRRIAKYKKNPGAEKKHEKARRLHKLIRMWLAHDYEFPQIYHLIKRDEPQLLWKREKPNGNGEHELIKLSSMIYSYRRAHPRPAARYAAPSDA
jgi:hypothetical protein